VSQQESTKGWPEDKLLQHCRQFEQILCSVPGLWGHGSGFGLWEGLQFNVSDV